MVTERKETTPKAVKSDMVGVEKNAMEKKLDAVCAVLRKLKGECEKHWGVDIDGDGKIGSVKVLMPTLILVLAMASFTIARDVVNWGSTQIGTAKVTTADAGTATLTVDQLAVSGTTTTTGVLTPNGGIAPKVTAVAVTNGAAVAVTAGVIELTNTGGATTATNAITITAPYAVIDQLVLIRVASSSNFVKIADNTTLMALGSDVVMGANDTLLLYISATNVAEKVSSSDN